MLWRAIDHRRNRASCTLPLPQMSVPEINHVRRGSGPPLVLLHGLGSRWQMWEPVLDALAAEHDVIALDLPGFGASPPPPAGTPAGVPSQCDMLEAFFAELGIERPHVAGNSMGGYIALELARRGRAASAVALSPAGFHTTVQERAIVVAELLALRTMARYGKPLSRLLVRTPTGRRLAVRNVIAHGERMSAEQVLGDTEALARSTWFQPNLWWLQGHQFSGGREIEVPVTIAWGEKDALLLPRQAARALREIPSASFVSLRDCGHVPTYDDPELVARVILGGTRA